MARLSITARKSLRKKKYMAFHSFWESILELINLFLHILLNYVKHFEKSITVQRNRYSYDTFERRKYMQKIIYKDDNTCKNTVRMNRSTFFRLCKKLEATGFVSSNKNMLVDEQVAITLHILAHHEKQRTIGGNFECSREPISRHFRKVINAIICLQQELFKAPEPVPEDSTDERWKWFKGCLGALDGTHIEVRVPIEDKPKYRTRKGQIATNVLGVCSQDMQFIYVLPGWEGSAADGRILRDAISRRNGLVVPRGSYYLVDAGYTNCDGFLAPFRGQRYHLNDWREGHRPTTAKECYNMKHSSARNVIERLFGLLKTRWGILRSPSYYPIQVQNRIILACCLMHNYIRQEMGGYQSDDEEVAEQATNTIPTDDVEELVTTVESSEEWNTFRNNLAITMFDTWRQHIR